MTDGSSARSSRPKWRRPSAARVARVRDRLRETYGIPTMAVHERPLDELILTVLSQSTNDRNRDVAFLRLRERFGVRRQAGGSRGRPAEPREAAVESRGVAVESRGRPIDYEAMLDAPVADIEEAIRPGGISKVKSARIKAILRAIADSARDSGDPLSLAWMKDALIEDSRAYLCALPGVGRKTAACVLLFAYGLPDVPVDTHVSRVGTRLGFFRPGAPFEELHDEMLKIAPAGQALELHVNLLRHGRRTCFARNPACRRCSLARMCPSRKLFEGQR